MLIFLVLLQAATPQRPAQLTQFLEQNIGFDAEQLGTVERGEAVVKVLDARDRRDVVVFGIITLPVSREQYVRALSDFPTSLRTPNRTQLGIFSSPAVAGDVPAGTIRSRRAAETKRCKPGGCGGNTPATGIPRIHGGEHS